MFVNLFFDSSSGSLKFRTGNIEREFSEPFEMVFETKDDISELNGDLNSLHTIIKEITSFLLVWKENDCCFKEEK